MLLSVFDKYIFLQSLGWGIANSLWQAALLWLIYQLIIATRAGAPALFKQHLSLAFISLSFTWFIITVIQNYRLINAAGFQNAGWINISTSIQQALSYLSLLYMLLFAMQVIQFIRQLSQLHFLRNGQLIKAPVNIRLFTQQTAMQLGIKQKVAVWLSENIHVPSVAGFFKPVILLPVATLNQLTMEQAESVILHELAHIKRNDYLLNILQSVMELFLFFNPFVKMLGTVARKERENCCDDWVLNYNYDKQQYAAALLLLEQQRSNQYAGLAMAATSGEKKLLERIKRLFVIKPSVSLSLMQRIQITAVSAAMLLLIFVCLPAFNEKVSVSNAVVPGTPAVNAAPPAAVTASNFTELKAGETTIKNLPVKKLIHTSGKVNSIVSTRKQINEVLYSTTFINEELLQPGKVAYQNAAVVASEIETAATPTLLVKVEEEHSGSSEKRTYLLQLKNNNGVPEIKPMIMLSRQPQKLLFKSKNGSNSKAAADSIFITEKKRITS